MFFSWWMHFFQEVNLQAGFEKTQQGKVILEIHTVPLCWAEWTKPHELHIFTSGFLCNSTSEDSARGHLSSNWFVIRGVQEGSKGQTKTFSRRQGTETNQESLLNLCSHWFMSGCVRSQSPRPRADSLHPAHVIISIDSSPISVFVLLLKAHWLKGANHYPLQERGRKYSSSGLTCISKQWR